MSISNKQQPNSNPSAGIAQNPVLAAVFEQENVSFVNLIMTEGRDLVRLNNIETPAIPFIDKVNMILAGKLHFDVEPVSMHPNLTFDEVGNITSHPISYELASKILVYRNMVHFVRSVLNGG